MTDAEIQRLVANLVVACGGAQAFARQTGVSDSLIARSMSGEIARDEAVAMALGFVRRGEAPHHGHA